VVAAVTSATISSVVVKAAATAIAEVSPAAAVIDSVVAAAVDSAAAVTVSAAAAVVSATVAVAAAAVDSAAAVTDSAAGGGGGMPPQVVGEGKGVVKFFNPQKGFGFIVRDDGGEDVFVHISAVEQAGLTDLADGQPLEFTLVDRGGRISATNLRIDGEPMAVERAERAPERKLTGEKATGVVKFFNAMKGFGFIQRDDGQPDAFVHISAVERAGMPTLNEGDRLEFEIEVDRRGKFAAVNLGPVSE
jgi:CspA family cold shock protein